MLHATQLIGHAARLLYLDHIFFKSSIVICYNVDKLTYLHYNRTNKNHNHSMPNKPYPCSSVVYAFRCYVQWRMMHPRSRGSKLGPGTSALHKRIITNNSYTYDEQGGGSTVSFIICDRC